MRHLDHSGVHEVERNGELGCILDRLVAAASILVARVDGGVHGSGCDDPAFLDGTRLALGRMLKLAREARRIQSGEPRAYTRQVSG
jgi:hypothetical protein